MAYEADGTWKNEDDSVSSNVAKLQSQDSALMRGAIASGTKLANRRGMANSSMGIGAGVAAGLGAVTPIASQEAQQNMTKNLAAAEDKRARDVVAIEDQRQRDLSEASIKSQDRNNYVNALSTMAGNYQQSLTNTLQNEKINKTTRAAVQQNLSSVYQNQQQQLAKFYGVELQW